MKLTEYMEKEPLIVGSKKVLLTKSKTGTEIQV
nr:MAG TPA: hypothetical protein [Caudoviricetes sp.]